MHTHQSDESTTDTIKTETTPSDPLLAMVHQSINTSDAAASDISHVFSVKRSPQIQVCQCYLFQHANHTNQQLVDRGANGGLAGSDMRVIHRPYCKINIQGIDNHEVTGLDVVTAATLLNTSQGNVIGIFNKYAYLGKGSSIHSSGQLEWFKTNVDEKSVKVGGTQLITTLDGYSVPLLVKDGLAYATSLGRPTDQDMDTYPHVFFTSPDEWDPSVLDHDPTHLDGLDSSQVPDQPFGDPMFDACGDFNKHIIANLNTLLDAPPGECGSYTEISSVFTVNLHQSSPQEPDWNALHPFFAWTSPSSIKDTFNVTTSHGTAPHIQDYQSEPYHQHQNKVESHFGLAKLYTNTVMNTSGCPACFWLLCLQYICVVLNHLASPTLQGICPVQALEGTTPDISFMLHFSFYEPVYYRIDSSEPDLHFPSLSNEKKGYWVSFADNPGDRLTWRILTEDTQKIIIRSGIRSALRTTTNQRLASPSGEGPTLPFPIPYPQQSTNSLPLDPLDASTPNCEQFVKSQSGEDEDNPIHMANIDIPNLLGRSFLLPPEDNGERHMAKIIDIDDHGQPLEDIKFKLKINKDQAEEIMSYNQLMDYIQKGTDAEEDPDSLFKFRDIVAHQGPLESTDPNHKGSKYNVTVEWESGEVTYEPLTLISKDDPITCAVYAKKHDLLDTTGWKHLKRYAKTSKRLIRDVKQSRIRQVRAPARYQHGFQVPKDYNDAIKLDKENSNTHWQDAMDLELTQIHEYKVFKDTGKAQFHNGKVVTPDGFQKIRVHFVYAVKHDGRFKARLVADGHLTKEPVESIFSGVVSLRSLRMVVFLSQLNDLEIWGADVGNAYLEAYTDEKLCIIAGPEFKELQGHLLIMIKALYRTRSGGARWHDRLFDILQELKFKPSKADPDVWMRPEPGGTCYEYIAVYLTEDTQKIIIRSGIRSALRTTTNQRLASPSGEGPTLPFPIPYPQQSTNSLPLDPLDASTPNCEQFVKSQSGEDEDNPIHMANIDIPNLLGRSFLLPPEDNGERHMAKIIDIDDHGQPLEDIKFKLKINKDQAEEIMSYNQLMDYIQKGTDAEEDPDSLFKFRDIVAHQGPLESTDPNHKGSKYNVTVEWESGEVTYEPLTLISKDDPITCAVYAKKHDLLDTTGWKHLKRYAKTSKRLIRDVKQSRIRQVRAPARYQHGFQVPKDYNDAIKLDKENSNTHWQDAMDLELTQIHEYKVFKDTGKAQFHNGKVVTPDGFQKIRVHFVYAVKHDGRFKARLVADGHLTKEPVESIYSGVVSLRSLRMVVFLSQLNDLEIWGADVGNAYLEAYTDEKLCIIAGPEFKELQGHLLIMIKALYRTRSGGARWHDRLFDILQELKFKPSKADPDVWMRPEPGGTCYEYIAVYVDDLAIAAKDPQAFCHELKKKYNLKVLDPLNTILAAHTRKTLMEP